MVIFFQLLIGHYFGDFSLQSAFMAKAKCRLAKGKDLVPGMWLHVLTAHAAIHAGIVWWITDMPSLAAMEFMLHWLIDFAKGEGYFGFHTDQWLHVLCRIFYACVYFCAKWFTSV